MNREQYVTSVRSILDKHGLGDLTNEMAIAGVPGQALKNVLRDLTAKNYSGDALRSAVRAEFQRRQGGRRRAQPPRSRKG